MTKKTPSQHLLNIENHFAQNNPTLLQAAKVFHELDDLEFELGLLDNESTTASQYSWWPIVSVIGGKSPASTKFVNDFLGTRDSFVGIQSSNAKFTVLQHNNSLSAPLSLPGTALDMDHRLPFYQISRKIEQISPGEGENINSYLELKTINKPQLSGKLLIEVPEIGAEEAINPVTELLVDHVIDISDLIIIFCDLFDEDPEKMNHLINQISTQKDSNKFIYVISSVTSSPELIRSWQNKLAELNIDTGQFIVLSSLGSLSDPQNKESMAFIDQRLSNINHYRSYRILHGLEKKIRDLSTVIIPEISEAIAVWKERCHFSSLLILGFIASLMLFAEISFGFFAIIFDPIIGPLFLIALIAFMVPTHLLISKLQAKFIIERLEDRQKELHLQENLANVFEKSLTNYHMLMPSSAPVGWNKKIKIRLNKLIEKTKGLVLSLNDGFNVYDEPSTNKPAESGLVFPKS